MTARLIGGEMTVWSDLDGKHGPGPVSAATLRPLLATASGRTLVAGPHAPELLDSLPSSQLTLLARGLPDADLLAGRFAAREDVTVLCGSLDQLPAAPTYDTVVALDGLGRLRSAEDDATGESWAADLARLVAVLRPGGRLLLGLENLFGLHRLLALAPEPADADWSSAGEFDPTRPAAPAQLRAALTAAGLDVLGDYAAFPSAVLSSPLLADRERRGWVTATARRAVSPGPAALADPGRIADGAARAGILAELAPAWIVLAQHGASDDSPVLPAAILADEHGCTEIADRAALPTGPTLDEAILGAALRRDRPGLRELLIGWQGGELAGVPADQIVAAADGTRTALVKPGEPVAALRQLAGTMIRDGYAYLWPAPADEAELTALLAAMAGVAVPEAPVSEVAVPAVAGPAGPGPADLRELLMERDRLTRELAEARAKHQWYETMLLGREAELKRVRRINTLLLATLPGKAAKASYAGLRKARQAARRLKG
jgi:hypothetical protein